MNVAPKLSFLQYYAGFWLYDIMSYRFAFASFVKQGLISIQYGIPDSVIISLE